MEGIPQRVLAEEGMDQKAHARQNHGHFARRAIRVHILAGGNAAGVTNVPLRTGTGANVTTGVGIPGVQTIAGGATFDFNLYHTGLDGRAQLRGGVGELVAAGVKEFVGNEDADGRELNPDGWIVVPESIDLSLLNPGAGQTLQRMDGSAGTGGTATVPVRGEGEIAYRYHCGVGLSPGGNSPALVTVNGILHLRATMSHGGVNTPASNYLTGNGYEIVIYPESNPLFSAGPVIIPLTVT